MDWITITGLVPWDGRYELDLNAQPLTTREWGWAKRYAGYLPVNLDENTFTDPEMIAVLAIIALRRNGKLEVADVPDLWERFQDAPFGATVAWEAGPAEEDADESPPPGSSDERPSSNGLSSPTDSENSERHQSLTGSPAWGTSRSVPATSGS